MNSRFHFHASQIIELPEFKDISVPDFEVICTSNANRPINNSIIFFKELPMHLTDEIIKLDNCIILVPNISEDFFKPISFKNLVIPVNNPRLEFARLVGHVIAGETDSRDYKHLANGSIVGQNVSLGVDVSIEPFVFIDHDVTIGDHCTIKSGAKIRSFVGIGMDTIVGENAVIGGPGFGFERDLDGIPIRLPHLGGVQIGSRVEIGAQSTVVSGTIDPTIIEDDVKIDDHVFIAHNCIIRKASYIIACAQLSGSVEVGEYSWVGPNCSVINGIKIGNHSLIGIGAVVTKSVEIGSTVAGNPAETTLLLKAWNKVKKKLMKESSTLRPE